MDLLCGMIELTTAYTNALLVAILPFVNDFASKLDLDVPLPITTNAVARFTPDPEISPDRSVPGKIVISRGIGGTLLLTNGMIFTFDGGHVEQYLSAAAVESRRHVKFIQAGKITLSEKQAIEVARMNILKLGYDLDLVYANLKPIVNEKPQVIHGKKSAIYNLRWNKPNGQDTLSMETWINGETGRLEYLWLLGLPTEPPPALAVAPIVRPRTDRSRDLTEAENKKILPSLLPQANRLSERLHLPIERPITAEAVTRMAFYEDPRNINSLQGAFVLTNGFRFDVYGGRRVVGYSTPDAFFDEPHVRTAQLFGKWKVSRAAAIKLARNAVGQLGLSPEKLDVSYSPEVKRPELVGRAVIPRYLIIWDGAQRHSPGFAAVEIDAEKRRVVSLSFNP